MASYAVQIVIEIILAIVGIGVWRLQFIISKNEKKRAEKDENRETLQQQIVRFGCSTFLLSEAVAIAVKRGEPNGELEEALKCAKIVKKDVDTFLQEQGIKKIV